MSIESIGHRRRIVRTYPASPQTVWGLWTTVEGIESWWGPEGFRVQVHELDLRSGGKLEYSMIADNDEMRAYMIDQGMTTSHRTTIEFTEVVPYRRLAYTNVVDFVPGVDTYETETVIEFEPAPDGVRLVISLEAMHDDEWTERAALGWESELGKLEQLLTRGAV
jgi:uncharacterized protein YndB with AHSA1/START domain